jgi:hypothetical protein
MLHAGGSIIDNNPKVEISGNAPFHFEVLHFSTSILGFLQISQDFWLGFYKMVDPTDLPAGELWAKIVCGRSRKDSR